MKDSPPVADPARSVAPTILVDQLVKSFPRRRPVRELLRRPFAARTRVPALRGVSFALGAGELVGLLGPNGAGKSTLLKILSGVVIADGGRAEIGGVPVGRAAAARAIGLVHGEERSFYWRLTARENLHFFGRLYHLDGAARARRVEALLERVGLAADADRRFGDYSSGMRQKLAIARALLPDPPVLLMDEPTRSLDPVGAAEMRDWIGRELRGALGKTVLMATHNLHEAESLCDRVVVIAKGAIRADDTPARLRQQGLGGAVHRLAVRGAVPATLASGTLLDLQPAAGGAVLLVRLAAADGLDALLGELRAAGLRIDACAPEDDDLETVFRRLVQEQA